MKNTITKDVDPRQETMDALFKAYPAIFPKRDDLIEGKLVEQKNQAAYFDLSPFGTGIIYGREYLNAFDTIKGIKPGDMVTAKVLDPEDETGYIALSLREARQDVVWKELEELQKSNTPMTLPIAEANRGGLIIEWKGIKGFLPASQLKTEHYPKVEDADKDKIMEELQKLVGQKMSVYIIGTNQKEDKLIFSEKEAESEESKKVVSKYNVGDVVEGEVTGVVDFGIFVKIEEGLEGLAHISELDWGLVEDPNKLFKAGDKVKAKVITIKDDKISLSVKALKPDPWISAKDKFKKEDIVKGVVIKFNRHGALVSIEEGVAGLVHISEFKTEEEMRKKMDIGKPYMFQITLFEPEEHKMVLSYIEEPK